MSKILNFEENKNVSFFQITTFGKDYFSCATSSLLITKKLISLLEKDSLIEISYFIEHFQKNETNINEYRNFGKKSIDWLLQQLSKKDLEENFKMGLIESINDWDQIYNFISLDINNFEKNDLIEKKYWGISFTNGYIMYQLLNHYKISLSNIFLFINGFYTNDINEELIYYNCFSNQIEKSTLKEFPNIIKNIFENIIHKNYLIFLFSGEIKTPFSTWVTLLIRKKKLKLEFILFDPANNKKFNLNNSNYLIGYLNECLNSFINKI